MTLDLLMPFIFAFAPFFALAACTMAFVGYMVVFVRAVLRRGATGRRKAPASETSYANR